MALANTALWRIVQTIGRIFYNIFPPSLSTNLACSKVGKYIASKFMPATVAIYHCQYDIKLKLMPNEAFESGVLHTGIINKFETELLIKYLKRDDIFVDVGTFVDGWHSILASKIVGDKGRVISFEPMPQHFDRFSENIRLNNCSNITAECLALSDTDGTATFHELGSNSSLLPDDRMKTTLSVTVKTQTLDSYVKAHGIKKMDFLKIDVEGAEPFVIKGANDTIKSKVNYLLVEVIEQFLVKAGSSRNELIKTIEDYGFKSYIITRSGLKPWKTGMASETLNMFFIRNTPII